MTDKKIIVIALILVALLVGTAWYYKNKQPIAAVISVAAPEETAKAPLENGIALGDPTAPVVMEEYTNFLCPACGHFATDTFGKIKDEYIQTGKVRMTFYIFPPKELGQAALCAQEQNKFVEYHDYLFFHQKEISSKEVLTDFAAKAGLDSQQFSACFSDENKYKDKIQKWYDEGVTRGVDATPTFFINGQKFIGAQPLEEFKKIIDEKLNQEK